MISMGIDVGGTNLRVGAVNETGEVLLSFREPTPQGSSPDFLVERIMQLFHQVQSQLTEPIQGLGLGWPGAVNRVAGTVLETPNIKGFKDFPLQHELQSRLKIFTQIENDAKCAGLAEKKFGVAQPFKDFLLLTFGTGIGGVIFSNSQLVQGRSGLAGEIGHFCLYPGGIACDCGGQGCFERYASAKALERRAEKKLGRFLPAREILELAETNSDAQGCIQEYIVDLSLAVGSLINIFNPEAIVFSGGLFTTGGGRILTDLKTELSKQGFQALKNQVQLLPSSLEGKAGVIGAAALGFSVNQDSR